MFNPNTNKTSIKYSFLSHAGGQPLEYIYLSGVTGDAQYSERVVKIRTVLKNADKKEGLYRSKIDINGNWLLHADFYQILGDRSNAFYFGLLKSHLQSAGRDAESLAMYREAIESVEKSGMMLRKSKYNFDYVTSYQGDEMHYSSCSLGAMLSLGAQAIATASTGDSAAAELAARHRQLAKGITETCYAATNRTATRLPSEYIIKEDDFVNWGSYYLR